MVGRGTILAVSIPLLPVDVACLEQRKSEIHFDKSTLPLRVRHVKQYTLCTQNIKRIVGSEPACDPRGYQLDIKTDVYSECMR